MKATAIFIFLISSTAYLNAQFFDSYNIGISTNFTDVNAGKDYKSFNEIRRYGTGFGMGIFPQKILSNRVLLETGLEFSIKSTILDLSPTPITTQNDPNPTGEFIKYSHAKSNLYLISLPLNLQFNALKGFYISGGSFIDIKAGNLNDSYEWEYRGNTYEEEDTIFEHAERVSLGYSFGIGKGLNLAGKKLNLFFQYRGDATEMIRKEGFLPVRKNSIEFWLRVPVN